MANFSFVNEEMMTHSTVDTRLTGKEQIEHIRAEAERRKKLIPFDWRELPRIDWPFGETHAKSFDGWIIVQADGRKISVQEFHQNFIYAGSLMGVQSEPTRYLEEAIGRAEQLWPSINIPPVLLPPALYWGRKERVTDGKDTSYDWMTLPRVRCIAKLVSTTAASDDGDPFSSLVVIWFQDYFGMPDAGVQQQLTDLDWNSLALNWCP